MEAPAPEPSRAAADRAAPRGRLRMPTDPEAAALVLLAALIPRLLHLQQIARHDPFFRLPAVDGAVYHDWARAIAAGDLVGEGVFTMGPLYPYLMAGVYALAGPDLFEEHLDPEQLLHPVPVDARRVEIHL